MGIYLDYNASAPIDERVLDVMVNVYKNIYGNADSRTHDYGDNARKIVEDARKQVATLLGINPGEVFFTSGATEGSNIAMLGLKEYAISTGRKHIIVSSIEHKAILQTAKQLEKEGFEVDYINPEITGIVSTQKILDRIRDDTLLVCLMHVNNETGTIQPVKEIGEALSNTDTFFMIDVTQSCGKLVEEIRDLKYDILSLSAHKFGGPQGIGALILKKKKYRFPPVKNIMYGGSQEHDIRPGTIPVALVAGLGKACEIAKNEYKDDHIHCKEIKKMMIAAINDSDVLYEINGNQDLCIQNTLNVCFIGVSSEALMLSSKQYCGVSNGSACNSDSYEGSFVLKAMGIPEENIECSIRISWGRYSELNSIRLAIYDMLQVAKSLTI